MNSIRIDGVWKIKEIVEDDVTLAGTLKDVRQQLTDYERKFLKSADEYLLFGYEHGELAPRPCKARPTTPAGTASTRGRPWTAPGAPARTAARTAH